jgi:hypothetical protein
MTSHGEIGNANIASSLQNEMDDVLFPLLVVKSFTQGNLGVFIFGH